MILCVLDRLSVCNRAREGGGWRRGGGKVGPQSMQLYFHDFACLSWIQRASDPLACRILCLFSVSQCTDPKYTPPVTELTEHTRVFFRTYNLWSYWSACVPTQFARPLPAARTHIVSHHPPSGPQCFKLSLRDFLALCFPPPFESLLSIYESLAFILCVHPSISSSLPIIPIPFISGLFPRGRRRRSGGWE